MAYNLSYGPVTALAPIANNFESFLLFYTFNMTNPVVITSYYAAFLVVHNNNYTQGQSSATAPVVWPTPQYSRLQIDPVAAPQGQSGYLTWISDDTTSIQITTGRSHATLYVTGNNAFPASTAPVQFPMMLSTNQVAAQNWTVTPFKHPNESDEHLYMPQSVSIEGTSIPIHSIYRHREPNRVNIAGYVAQLQKNSGFDIILSGTGTGKSAPTFTLERIDVNKNPISISVPSNNGCAWVAAGGFKSCIPLISTFSLNCLKNVAGGVALDKFTENTIALVNSMDMIGRGGEVNRQRLLPTLESCDDPRYSPVDSSSPDSPVEYILFV